MQMLFDTAEIVNLNFILLNENFFLVNENLVSRSELNDFFNKFLCQFANSASSSYIVTRNLIRHLQNNCRNPPIKKRIRRRSN